MLTLILEPFILKAILAGVGISIVVGALGCFVIWRKMAYLGDSLSHSSLLGIALGLAYGLNLHIAIILICSLFAIILVWLQYKKMLSNDSLLGILSHASLASGMILISLLKTPSIDLYSYLFGDILTVTKSDLMLIYFGAIIILLILFFKWQNFCLITISKDLAKSQNINIFYHQILLMFLMAITIAISIQIVGILLITSLLIIPSASARKFAKSPESMAIIASIFATLSVIFGIISSIFFDIPSGPAIVISAVIIFIFSQFANTKSHL